MKVIKTIAFLLSLQLISTLSFAAGQITVGDLTSNNYQQYQANISYCNNPVNNCVAATINSGMNGSGQSTWLTCPDGYYMDGLGRCIPVVCPDGYYKQGSSCVRCPTAANNIAGCNNSANSAAPCTSGNRLIASSGQTVQCGCLGNESVKLARCTCNNGVLTTDNTNCATFTKYRVCPNNPCQTQTGSCYRQMPGECTWGSCSSANISSSGNAAAASRTSL